MGCYLAVDIGASSGRHILGWVENGRILTQEVYRFENKMIKKNGYLCWDTEELFQEVVNGLAACKEGGRLPDTMGIDTWGVDFVLLDREGRLLGDTVAYRDSRTEGMMEAVEKLIPPEELYARTGVYRPAFNTIYQLMALKREHPEQLEGAEHFLMIPDYLHYRLTGVMANEYTDATTTGLINAETKTWDRQLLERLGYPQKLFREPALPGTELGGLSSELRDRLGFNCRVVLPASHDTGSAFLAVPAFEEDSAYLSSGTWSLLGLERPRPITTGESMRNGFANEGGYQYRFRYLKNIMGLWMIQSVRREAVDRFPQFTEKPSFGELEALAREAKDFPSRVDVESGAFLAPDSMVTAVREACRSTGQLVPETPGEIMACLYHSLAESYRDTIRQLEGLTGLRFRVLHIVGGGSKDGYLNQLTANATGLPVYAGPTEGTALGNLMAQMLRAKEFPDLYAARRAERDSFEIKVFEPEK